MNVHTTWSLTSALRMAKQVSVLIIYMPNGIWVSYKKYSLMRQHYNTTGSWLNKKMAILKKGLLFMQDFAWQRSTFYLLCSVWALLKREQGSTRDVRKTPQTVLITSHWTDYGLRTVVYVISKLAKCLELNQSMGLLVNDFETTRQSTYTWMEYTALSILAEHLRF